MLNYHDEITATKCQRFSGEQGLFFTSEKKYCRFFRYNDFHFLVEKSIANTIEGIAMIICYRQYADISFRRMSTNDFFVIFYKMHQCEKNTQLKYESEVCMQKLVN